MSPSFIRSCIGYFSDLEKINMMLELADMKDRDGVRFVSSLDLRPHLLSLSSSLVEPLP